MALRKFLFLDSDTVTEYLSQIEGSIIEEFDQTKTGGHSLEGKIGTEIMHAGGGKNSSTEISQKHRITPEANFQKLYKSLGDDIQYLDAFDEEIWNQLERNEILEVQARIRIPQIIEIFKAVSSVQAMLPLLGKFNNQLQEPQANGFTIEEMIKLIAPLSDGLDNAALPIIFEAASTPGFTFISDLERGYIRTKNISELAGEATVVGKIVRIIPAGEEIVVSPILDGMMPLMAMGKVDKDQLKQSQQGLIQQGMAEVINGPAIRLAITAIYR